MVRSEAAQPKMMCDCVGFGWVGNLKKLKANVKINDFF